MTTGMTPGSEDTRYRITVFLVSQHRPKYTWSFHCINCGVKIAEAAGEVMYLSDVDDIHTEKRTLSVHCPGKYCRFWYQFNLG